MEPKKIEKEGILLNMHKFYAEEARHQRSMMWETVKWFSPVLVAIHGLWLHYLNKFLGCKNDKLGIILVLTAFGGILLSIICLKLLRSFYKTNLKYITMFAKVEDELSFDRRIKRDTERTAFHEDDYITDDNHIIARCSFDRAKHFISANLQRKYTMYCWMKSVFYLFMFGFLIEITMFSYNVSSERILLMIMTIISAVGGIYLLVSERVIKKQGFNGLIVKLTFKEKALFPVSQKNYLIVLGILLLIIAVALQLFVFI